MKDPIAIALLRAIRAVDYIAGGDASRDEPSAIVDDGLKVLLRAGVSVEELCDDTQFDAASVQELAAELAREAAEPQPTGTDGVYSIDVKVVATAYIRAASPEDAKRKLDALGGMASLEVGESAEGDLPISGLMYDDPDLPELSLSPAMTCYGALRGGVPQRVDD